GTRRAGCFGDCTTCNFDPDVLSGFTIVRNAVRLDYPIVPAIRSILDICDEVVVNVGRSDDGTRDLVAGIGDPRIRILDSVWDFSRGGGTLSYETNRAMAACGGAGGVYIQAEEVLHESGAALIRETLRRCDGEPRVEGLPLDWTPLLRRFSGTHPRVAQPWIAAQQAAVTGPVVGPRRFRPGHVRLYLSHWMERLTGMRLFEYRNYVDV